MIDYDISLRYYKYLENEETLLALDGKFIVIPMDQKDTNLQKEKHKVV